VKRLFSLYSLISGLIFSSGYADEQPKKWAVYYGDNLPAENFLGYNLVVLEPDQRPPISLLLEQGKTVLGYISLGEISKDRSYFKSVQEEGILFQKNPNWPDAQYVDMRSNKWTSRVVDDLIPAILYQHFSGIFIDTIDNAEALERKDPVKYRKMKEGAIKLIKTIRLHFPDMKIMLNRGFELLPYVAKDINSVLAESIFSVHNFKTGEEDLVKPEIYASIAKELKEAQQLNPSLEIYTLDYWNTDDPQGIKKIYEAQRAQGFIPYVATLQLNEIIPEP
jgi:uncharacterized protein (TIGR01370 family)